MHCSIAFGAFGISWESPLVPLGCVEGAWGASGRIYGKGRGEYQIEEGLVVALGVLAAAFGILWVDFAITFYLYFRCVLSHHSWMAFSLKLELLEKQHLSKL